ncbi:MAG: DNA-3-methyladenine glycosylase I [Deltaproteobacteria bacterium]|nr:DNA-3-methyladenine glycosylase I [Deltaproteobacteria bacterium]
MTDSPRCPWVDPGKPDYVAYHDSEWGVPVHEDRVMFEFLTLEAAQAGLSWYTILRRREGYRRAFAGFDPEKVAAFDEAKQALLRTDSSIIRNRAKIASAINNARAFLRIQEEFGSFSDYIWRFVDGRPKVNVLQRLADYPTTSPEAECLSRDLKQRGFSFMGPTVVYAHMQATGLVNDHSVGCFRRREIIDSYR